MLTATLVKVTCSYTLFQDVSGQLTGGSTSKKPSKGGKGKLSFNFPSKTFSFVNLVFGVARFYAFKFVLFPNLLRTLEETMVGGRP